MGFESHEGRNFDFNTVFAKNKRDSIAETAWQRG